MSQIQKVSDQKVKPAIRPVSQWA